MKFRGILAVALLIGGIALIFASSSGANSGARSAGAQTIGIYSVGSLTGSADYEGIQICDAMKLAGANINSHGGIKSGPLKGSHFDIQCVDDGLLAAKAASIAARMVSTPSVWAMAGFEASGEALAAAQQAERSNLTVIASDVAADFLTTQVHNVYVVQPSNEAVGGAATDMCKSYLGATKIASLNNDYSYIPSFMTGLKATVKKDHLTDVSDALWPPTTTTNFGPYLTKIQAAGAQCVEVGAYPPVTCQIASQARQQGLKQAFIDLTAAWTSSSCQQAGGAGYKGMIFANLLPPSPAKGSLTANVMAQFAKQYKTGMSYLAVNAYDSVLAIEYAIEAGATDRTKLNTYLAKVNGPGVGLTVRFTNNRIGPREITFYEATASGAVQPVATYNVHPDGTWVRLHVANCKQRPSCQRVP